MVDMYLCHVRQHTIWEVMGMGEVIGKGLVTLDQRLGEYAVGRAVVQAIRARATK